MIFKCYFRERCAAIAEKPVKHSMEIGKLGLWLADPMIEASPILKAEVLEALWSVLKIQRLKTYKPGYHLFSAAFTLGHRHTTRIGSLSLSLPLNCSAYQLNIEQGAWTCRSSIEDKKEDDLHADQSRSLAKLVNEYFPNAEVHIRMQFDIKVSGRNGSKPWCPASLGVTNKEQCSKVLRTVHEQFMAKSYVKELLGMAKIGREFSIERSYKAQDVFMKRILIGDWNPFESMASFIKVDEAGEMQFEDYCVWSSVYNAYI